MRSVWSGDIRFKNDFCGARRFAVELAICVLIGPERRAIERYAGKNTSRAGVAQNLRAHISVCIGRGRTSLRSGGDRCIRSQLHLGAQQAACAAVIHDEKYEVGCLPANLQTNAAAFQRIHGRCAPGTGEVFTCAAYHSSATVATANNKRGFQHRRHHDNAAGLVDQVLWNVVWNLEDLLHDSPCVLKTILLGFCFAGIFGRRQWPQSQQASHYDDAALCEVHSNRLLERMVCFSLHATVSPLERADPFRVLGLTIRRATSAPNSPWIW